MGREYFLEAKTPLSDGQRTAVRSWLLSVMDAVVYTKDNDTWFLFHNNAQKNRRIQWWLNNPNKNDYLTSCIVIHHEGITISLVEDDADRVAVELAKWWLYEFGGRLLECGLEITPQEMLPDDYTPFQS